MSSNTAIPVKEVDIAGACRHCGRPTWSLAQLCVSCKRLVQPEDLAAPPRYSPAVPWPQRLLMHLPPRIANRFVARLVRHTYCLPGTLILAAVWLASLACGCFLGSIGVTGLVYWAIALSDQGWAMPLDTMPAVVFIGVVIVPIVNAFFVSGIVCQRMRRRVLRDQILDCGATVRLRTCPACGYDQAGTAGATCPECGCAVAFPRESA